ncbi:ribonuclease D [Hyphococcus flavus]|uniref:Ribonuclease D n=1 Tax=Hyphococcus flavus TaxID=1866326 RepID=A0AAF0CBM2_9PROT|nr:ribonuclease D [Hyphococcus flavus]WDI31315.1 ribonuclease D [Hyphococcus flavus]
MQVITTTEELHTFSAALRDKPFVAVDTEFMREKTYWPILCLIQAAAEGEEAIIDPLAEGIDLTPFLEVLTDDKVVKVFHAARQDLEIFYKLLGEVPGPLFDTQIAAMACGFGDQIGYEPLMRTLLKAKIDKGSRFTDWSRRPLTDSQLAYALSDVTHLRDAYPILKDSLEGRRRKHWVEEEMHALNDDDLYHVQPAKAWKRLKLRGVRPKEMGVVVKLAEWREHEAQTKDIPRSRILKDESIYELARLQPKDAKSLARARSIPSGFERSKSGAAIIDVIGAGITLPKAETPKIDKPDREKVSADVLELLKVLLKRQCETFHVAPKLIATTADLEEIARSDDADVPALSGWRREIFGDAALRLKRGEIALKLKGDSVDIIDV